MKPSLNRHTSLAALLVVSMGGVFPGLTVSRLANAEGAGAPASAHGPQLSDAQIAAVVVEADKIDIDNGKLALRKSHDPAVRQFARQMVRDHSAINKAAVQLVTRLGVTPAPSDLSRSLAAGSRKTFARLSTLHGQAFDRAYIHNEVTYHKLVIRTAKTVLIPGAQNPELKQTLVQTAPTFVEHLHHAEMLWRHVR